MQHLSANNFKFFPVGQNTGWIPGKPVKISTEKVEHSQPDVYRPSYPVGPEGAPDFPQQPKWLPPFPSVPIVEVPNQFPMELPPAPNPSEWSGTPSPKEIPDWGKMPQHFPTPAGPEIQMPKHFPPATSPDGMWLLS